MESLRCACRYAKALDCRSYKLCCRLQGEKLRADNSTSRYYMPLIHGHPGTLSFDGKIYDFAHLHPIKLVFNLLLGVEIPAECRFKSHCYTRELDPDESFNGLIRIDDDNRNVRYFCPKRHALSLKLAGWMVTWCHQKCIISTDYRHGAENWLIVEDSSGAKVKVAFSIDKHKNMPQGVMLWVKTVHPYDRSSPPQATRDNSIPFNTLAKAVAYTGKPPRAIKIKARR